MPRLAPIPLLCSLALSVCAAAEFQSGQAARAVIGQPSFSARETGVNAIALSLANGRLYVADTTRRLLAFDLSQIPGPAEDPADRLAAGCAVCALSPVASVNQSVLPGVATVSVYGKSVAIADPANRRVLVWRDASSESALKGPDLILGPGPLGVPLNASTLLEPISVALDGQRLFVGDAGLRRVLIWNALPQYNNQPADAVLGQQSFSTLSLPEAPAADTIVRPTALLSDGRNLFVADSVSRRILIFTAADVGLNSNALANSASLAPGPLAPGTLVTISATGITPWSDSADDGADHPLPKSLAGVEVVLDGEALPLLSVSPDEIRAQLPYDVANRSSASLYIRAQREDGAVMITNPVAISLLPATPGLFAFSGKEPRPAMTVHDGENSQPGAPVTITSPAEPGEAITLWAAGLGIVAASPDKSSAVIAGVPNTEFDAPVLLPITASVNGVQAEVLSATLPEGAIGIYEVRVVLPSNLPGSSPATLSISQEGRESNTVTIPVKNAIQ